jgi:hypothetical protein
MKKRSLLVAAGILIAGLVFVARHGENEVQGAAVPEGDNAKVGTTNVIFSEWKALPDTAVFSSKVRKDFDIAAPEMTEAIIEKGLVYVYLKSGGGATVLLPRAEGYIPSKGTVISGKLLTAATPQIGRLLLTQDWLTDGYMTNSFAASKKVVGGYTHIRYVIIPGGVQAARLAAVDFADYEGVKKVYHLEDY